MATKCATCNHTTEYNGWTSYETWLVHLWLSNEEPLYHEANALADRHYAYDHQRGDAFKEWVGELLGEDSGFKADLLGAALSEVDWEEVGNAFKAEEEE